MVHGSVAGGDLEPEPSPGEEFVGDGFAGSEADSENAGVLMNDGGTEATVFGDDELFFGVEVFWAGVPLGVGGREVALVWGDPDLQESDAFRGRRVKLAMEDA